MGGIIIGLIIISWLIVFGHAEIILAVEVPALSGRINDLAGLLLQEQASRLEEQLTQFEQQTGHQIAVLTIRSLGGDALEDFSIRVAEAWKIGQKGFDNGAILLIVRDDRKLRIEVGYGLEGVMPDAIASRIIREVIVPRFRDNDFGGGIEAGVDAIMKVTQGEKLPEDVTRRGSRNKSNDIGNIFLPLGLFLPVFMSQLLVPRSRAHGMMLGGILGGGIGGTAAALTALFGSQFSVTAILAVFIVAVVTGALGISPRQESLEKIGPLDGASLSIPIPTIFVVEDGGEASAEGDLVGAAEVAVAASVEVAVDLAAGELQGAGNKMNAETFFTNEEQERIQQAVMAAEKKTSGEIVPMVVSASGRYAEVELSGLVIGLVLGTLAAFIWHDPWGSVQTYLLWPVVGAVLGFAVCSVPRFKSRLIPKHRVTASITPKRTRGS